MAVKTQTRRQTELSLNERNEDKHKYLDFL
jgi:hypothetical protein